MERIYLKEGKPKYRKDFSASRINLNFESEFTSKVENYIKVGVGPYKFGQMDNDFHKKSSRKNLKII